MANVVDILITAQDKASAPIRSATDTLRKMRGPLLAVTAATVGMGVVAVKAASSLEEATNKATVVFGKSAEKIREFAKHSAASYGISKAAANEYAGTLGTILKASGMTTDASADMSIEIVKLSADLASFNDIPIDVALKKIRSGLVGEVEPLRAVGILLNQAAVETKALEMGLIEQGEAMSEAAKVQARYALIMDKTTDQQGDFIRTSGSLANQMRIMAALFEDSAAILGEELIPVVTVVANTLTTLLKAFAELSPEIKTTIVIVAAAAAGLAALGLIIPPLVTGITGIATAFRLLATSAITAHFATGIIATGFVSITRFILDFNEAAMNGADGAKAWGHAVKNFKNDLTTLYGIFPDATDATDNLNEAMADNGKAMAVAKKAADDLAASLDGVKKQSKTLAMGMINDLGDWEDNLGPIAQQTGPATTTQVLIGQFYKLEGQVNRLNQLGFFDLAKQQMLEMARLAEQIVDLNLGKDALDIANHWNTVTTELQKSANAANNLRGEVEGTLTAMEKFVALLSAPDDKFTRLLNLQERISRHVAAGGETTPEILALMDTLRDLMNPVSDVAQDPVLANATGGGGGGSSTTSTQTIAVSTPIVYVRAETVSINDLDVIWPTNIAVNEEQTKSS